MRANVQEICYNLTMRRVRITYSGAYHHVMNRGYDGNPIFAGNVTKSHFLDYLESAVTEMKMRIFAYCIMDNHYHMVSLMSCLVRKILFLALAIQREEKNSVLLNQNMEKYMI